MTKNYTAILLLAAAAVCWSTSGILIKLVDLPALAISGWRSCIAGLFILVVCRNSVVTSFDRYTLGAAFCLGVFSICFVGATKLSTAANAIVLQYSASAYVAVLAPKILGERTSPLDWGALVAVVAGVCLFFVDDLSLSCMWGSVLGVVGSFFWAGTVILLRLNKAGSSAWSLGLGSFMAAALCLPFMFAQRPGTADLLGLLGLGVISIGAGYAIFSYAIKEVHALDAVLVCSIEPFINPLWVFLFCGELPGPAALAGGTLVLSAVTIRSILAAVNSRKLPVKN